MSKFTDFLDLLFGNSNNNTHVEVPGKVVNETAPDSDKKETSEKGKDKDKKKKKNKKSDSKKTSKKEKGEKKKKDKKQKNSDTAESQEIVVVPPYYTNRELSWLKFNERVLEEAGNDRVPLAERLSFISIYQSNLDEFFMVRVGSLMDQMAENDELRENKTLMKPSEQISAILKNVRELEKKKASIYNSLFESLSAEGINIINFNKLDKVEAQYFERYFKVNIAPYLSPMIVNKQQPFPFLGNREIFALLIMADKQGNQTTGIVSCTNEVFKRLIEVPSRPGYFMLSEELILHFAPALFKSYTVKQKTLLRVTRNADINTSEAYDEELNIRDMMSNLVKKRRRMSPVRIEISRNIDSKTREFVAKNLGLNVNYIVRSDVPLDIKFTSQLQKYLADKPQLFYEKRVSRYTNQLDRNKPFIPQIENHDVILSYPFYTFRYFIRLLKEAAVDESVLSIKMTLYRVADQSKIVDALIEAAENGKEVDVLVELRARFDEESNIDASKRLEEAGCNVIYGLSEYKVHSKLLIITRKSGDSISYITQIGTGNFNEKTAKLYTDLSLLTADYNIGTESTKVFNSLLLGETVEDTEYLLVAPHCLQNRILEMIDDEIEKVQNGEDGYFGAKINSLTDKRIIDKLIEASQRGVKIDLIVRGVCCLKPGFEGFTDNIRVVSLVGRYLEHSRIYIFGAGEGAKIYISSADFMTRNTVRRVEIATPLFDSRVRARVRHIFDTILMDDEKCKELHSEGRYYAREINEERLNSQELFYSEAYAEEDSMKQIPSEHHNDGI